MATIAQNSLWSYSPDALEFGLFFFQLTTQQFGLGEEKTVQVHGTKLTAKVTALQPYRFELLYSFPDGTHEAQEWEADAPAL